jgi:3D (Asp-Asp-Asp) domain-containing protein
MNTLKQLKNLLVFQLIAVIMLGTLIPTTSANAGVLNWIGIKKEDAQKVTTSFDKIYGQVKESNLEVSEKEVATTLVNETSISQISSPAASTITQKITKKTYVVELSAYSSTPDQTDDSPFITAKGTYVRDGIVATNFLPFGTRVKVPAIYGDKIFIVEDRMNKRYTTNIDIWFADRETALKFGRKKAVIEVVSL